MFTAPQPGEYTFTVEEGSDLGVFQIEIDNSRVCCENTDDAEEWLAHEVEMATAVYIPSDPAHSQQSVTVTLNEGGSYYIYMFYINRSGDAKFKLSVTLPSGETTTDFTGMVNYLGTFDCNNYHTTSKLYSEWDDVYSTTYSTTVITHDMTTTTTFETVYYVLTPAAPTSSTVESSSTSDIPLTSLEPSSSEVP